MEKPDIKNEELQGFGQRIIALRKSLDISQIDFADSIEVSHSFMSQIESGKNKPGFTFFKNIFLKYNVTPEYLFTGKGPMFKEPRGSNENFGDFNDRIHQMLKYMNKIPIVKLSILQYFTRFLFDNKQLIDFDNEWENEKMANEKKFEESKY